MYSKSAVWGVETVSSRSDTSVPQPSSGHPRERGQRADPGQLVRPTDDEVMATMHAMRTLTRNTTVTPEQEEYVKLLGKAIPPVNQRDGILQKAHLQGHYGEKAVIDLVYNQWGYWWPSLRRDALSILARCPQCQRYNVAVKGYHPPKSPTAFMPGDHWQIDVMELPTSVNGFSHVLCVLDVFTSYLLTRPMKTKSAEETAQNLLTLIADWGPPKVISSDMGGEFANDVLKALFEKTHIEFHIATPKHHGSTGRVERVIRTLRFSLRKMLDGAMGIWDLILPLSTLYYNVTTRSLQGTNPYVLMFARDYNNTENAPENGWVPLGRDPTGKDCDEWLSHQLDMLAQVYPSIREAVEIKRTKQAEKFTRSHKIVAPLRVGDSVMMQDFNRARKDDPLRVGPYVVLEARGNGSYVISDGINEPLVRNISALSALPRDKGVRGGVDRHQPVFADAAPMDESEPADNANNGQAYEVDCILDHRGRGSSREYYVLWKGFSREESTWEPESNFIDTECIRRYFASKAPARQVKRKGTAEEEPPTKKTSAKSRVRPTKKTRRRR